MTQDSSEEAAIRAAESALYAAMIAVDLAALDKVLSPDLSYIHSTAVAEGKAEYLDRVKARHYDYNSIASRDVVMRIRGDLAVMNGTLDMAVATAGGPNLMMTLLFVLIWTKQDGRWLLSLRQAINAGVRPA
ncbi:nuclear transport factor 2 family protein [Bosea caraganae]|uniref:Nuclear transport factor 2 family protein n=1 Tax=Bosea caraganae TaxID=2763117 RepID=A0A370KZC3_9HYPH|nr:nuclear transport factor 2 family protein [Bosea caraganae]RDJ20350.1 nuclear transport factor 2 family protein [Bosea caraganae]RDJ26569.1 nuclear transport factor 2 family protein [Bosea caraganae]